MKMQLLVFKTRAKKTFLFALLSPASSVFVRFSHASFCSGFAECSVHMLFGKEIDFSRTDESFDDVRKTVAATFVSASSNVFSPVD